MCRSPSGRSAAGQGTDQVLQPAFAEILPRYAVWRGGVEQLAGGVRRQDLAAVAGGEQARQAIERELGVVAIRALLARPTVQRGAHPQGPNARGPRRCRAQRPLTVEGGGQGSGGPGKHDDKAIARRLQDGAPP